MKELSAGRAHLQQGAHTRPIPRSVFAISTYKTNILKLVLGLTTEEERMLASYLQMLGCVSKVIQIRKF